MELPFASGFYEDDTKPIASQECINWIPQIPQTNGISQAQLVQTPGISQFSNTNDFAARGEHEMAGIPYSVNGNTLYRWNSDGSSTSLGTITGAGKVSIADNGTEICIVVPGSTAYIYTVAGGLVAITDTDFTTTLGPSQYVVFHDSYFVHFNNDSAASTKPIFFISNLNQGLLYDALDFGTAEVDPDAITGLHVNRNQLKVGGRITMEPMQNIGGTGFPYQRIPGAVGQKGIRAKFSVKDFDNSYIFVGGGVNEKPAVWRGEGGGFSKISSPAIDNILQKLTDTELPDVFGSVYAENGHYIYYLHLNDRTFGYDASTRKWHERRSKNDLGELVNWRVNGIVEAYGKVLVTDNQSGKIGEMAKDIYTEYGDTRRYIFSTQPLSNQGKVMNFAQMELDCESGTAGPEAVGVSIYDDEGFTATGFDIDPFPIETIEPTISREISNNGGYSFNDPTSRGLGRQGEYKRRQIWRREGQSPDTRVYRFTHDGDIKMSVMRLMVE